MLPFIKEAVQQLFSKPSTEKYPAADAPAPEGYRGRIVFHADKCISCGKCEKIYPMNVEVPSNSRRKRNATECILCMKCVEECPKNALNL